jgi:hypothetical protein
MVGKLTNNDLKILWNKGAVHEFDVGIASGELGCVLIEGATDSLN